MGDPGSGLTPEAAAGRQGRGAPDIDVTLPRGPVPLSRMAPERALERVDRYDRRAEVTAYEALTSTGTVRISFRVVDDQPFVFHPGHFVGIKATLPRWGVRRSPYCIISPPGDDRAFQLLVRLVPEGPLSYYLGSLEVGDLIAFRGPSGRSMLPKEGDGELVLLATGVGIGPLLSLVQHLFSNGYDRPIRLYWGLRLAEDVCLVEELEEIHRRYERFSYTVSLSRPGEDWPGLRGRLTETVPGLLETLGGKRFYLVGNGAMIEEMSTALSDVGVDRRCIHEEVYFNARYRPRPKTLDEIRSRFVASDRGSPYADLQAGAFRVERPVKRAAGRTRPLDPSGSE
jgi:ferredoxin-NADP reductase